MGDRERAVDGAAVRRLRDRLDIGELLSLYDLTTDDHDFEELALCFTEDGCLRHATGGVEVRGRQSIRDHFKKRMTSYSGPAIHLHHGYVIKFVDDDNATGVVAASGMAVQPDGAMVAQHRYYDRYRREDGRWRLAERVLHFWYRMPLVDLPAAINSELRIRVDDRPRMGDLPLFATGERARS